MQKARPTRILGIDYGMARIGLSISDELKIIAAPLLTFVCSKKTEETVERLVKELEERQIQQGFTIQEIVVGMPFMMSGKSGFLADEVKHFTSLLKEKLTTPIILWDERLTTVQAERSLKESSLTRKRRSQVVDKVAAVILLQSYLDLQSLKNSL